MLLPVRIGDRLGSYRIVRSIGEGGMGAVFEAVHEQIGRRAAAKILTVDARRHPAVYQRFINEARAATQIDHPGVVQVFEFGQFPDGTPWMLMELLQGHTLAAYLRAARKAQGAPLGTEGLWIFHDLAAVLTRAHSKGIVHRDLKPSNVMIVEEEGHGERVKLLDFGIAKFLSESLGEGAAGPHHTRTGALMGTPAYMAPEQCKSSPRIDGKADVYALGVMLYELYTAQQPFLDAEPLALMMKKLTEPMLPLSVLAPKVPPEIAALTMAMLDLEPSQRPTMTEVQAQLAAFLRLPAARRSGFLPQVTPPEKPVTLDLKETAEPALTSTKSGPLPPVDESPPSQLPAEPAEPPRGPSPPALVPAGAALIPPTPPEHSSGQLARQSASLGQQPTRPERQAARALRAGLAVAGASLLLTTGIILWPWSPKLPKTNSAPSASMAASAPPAWAPVSPPARAHETAVPPPPAAPVEKPLVPSSSPPDSAPARRSNKPRCNPAPLSAGCVGSQVMALSRKQIVVQELAKLNVRLCVGESIQLRHRPGRMEVIEAPGSLTESKREQISFSLLGALGQEAQKQRLGDIVIRCPAP